MTKKTILHLHRAFMARLRNTKRTPVAEVKNQPLHGESHITYTVKQVKEGEL